MSRDQLSKHEQPREDPDGEGDPGQRAGATPRLTAPGDLVASRAFGPASGPAPGLASGLASGPAPGLASGLASGPASGPALAPPALSIVSPVYLGARFVHELVRQVREAAARVCEDYEIILVDDGSPDGSWERIREACAAHDNVRGIRLSRNFGQNHALTAALEASRGDMVVVLDCDLQDDPAAIPRLVEAARAGHDIVYTHKRGRERRGLKGIGGRLFHAAVSGLSDHDRMRSSSVVGNYSLLTRKVVDAFVRVRDCHRQYLGILRWLGFRATHVDVQHREREGGGTSYTFRKLVREAVNGITSQTDRLLYVSIAIGFVFFGASLLGALYIVVAWFVHGFREGWASVVVLILSSTGIILMSLGVTAIYVGKTFEQAKDRPLYVVAERLNPHGR
jgi:dolichol-phosphate mannosyltransferase